MNGPATENRSSTISAVKTPLGFLVFGLIVVEATIAGLAMAIAEYRGPLVWAVILSIPIFVLIVVGLAVWRPEALKGDRPFHESHANQFADDLFISLDGSFSNLEQVERVEAWLTIADVISRSESSDSGYSIFCEKVALRLKKLANMRWSRFAPGPIDGFRKSGD